MIPPRVAFAIRLGIGEMHYLRLSVDDMAVEEMSVAHFLAFKEKLVPGADGELVGASFFNLFSFKIFHLNMKHNFLAMQIAMATIPLSLKLI